MSHPDESLDESRSVHERSQYTCKQPGHDHDHHDRLTHALDDGLAVCFPIVDQKEPERHGGEEHWPKTSFVGRS
jgi:hypothetical protein